MTARRRRSAGHGQRHWWESLSDEELLRVRLCDLGLRIEGSPLEPRVERLSAELARARLRFRPSIWLSNDVFTPDGVPGFGVPFYLAHPRLARLEERHMLEVEGGDLASCMKLLRHETAHALDNAYRLHRRKRWRELFGYFSIPYRQTYVPRPRSKRYVQNLDYWYSQSHPAEDFAETFSIWLEPNSGWRERYEGWPALKKLLFIDQLMREIAERPPLVRSRSRPDSLSGLRMSLREYFRRKRAYYAEDYTIEYDEPLRRVFSTRKGGRSAAAFLARVRPEVRERVSAITGQHQYVVDQVLKELILSCRKLGLSLQQSESEARVDAAALVTSLTMSFLHGGPSEYRR
jgi:hypothetical protein